MAPPNHPHGFRHPFGVFVSKGCLSQMVHEHIARNQIAPPSLDRPLRIVIFLAVATPEGGLVQQPHPVQSTASHTLFLDKTPHNLLAMSFLARLAPGARFLHVMRDPRSIAWSLLSVRWGPDKLATAARWVDSYCGAWVAAEARAAGQNLPLTRLHIEGAAANPGAAGGWLTSQLGLGRCDDLFAGANIDVLNRWSVKATPAERSLLDARLGGWAAHFGYDPVHIGRRAGPAIPRPGTPDQAATD